MLGYTLPAAMALHDLAAQRRRRELAEHGAVMRAATWGDARHWKQLQEQLNG